MARRHGIGTGFLGGMGLAVFVGPRVAQPDLRLAGGLSRQCVYVWRQAATASTPDGRLRAFT